MKQAIDNIDAFWPSKRYKLVTTNDTDHAEKDMDGLAYIPWDVDNCHGYPVEVIDEYNRLKEKE